MASRYKERIDLNATLVAGGKATLKKGTVSGAWRRELDGAGMSGAFADLDTSDDRTSTTASSSFCSDNDDDDSTSAAQPKSRRGKPKHSKEDEDEPKYKPLNKVIRNKGDPTAVRQAKDQAKRGGVSKKVSDWLFPSTTPHAARRSTGGLKHYSLERFSDRKPALVLNRETLQKAVTHLSNSDPRLAALIARVGVDALIADCCYDESKAPTQASFFDKCVRSITFTMVSVDAGNSFLRRLAIKTAVCIEQKKPAVRKLLLKKFFESNREGGHNTNVLSPEDLLDKLITGNHFEIYFTMEMMQELVKDCEVLKGKQSGYPHLCGNTHPCGKNDDHRVFVAKARASANGMGPDVSAGFSNAKAGFIIDLVRDFKIGRVSVRKLVNASDREAAKMLTELSGIGDWCAGGILMHWLGRADILLYGDLTVRNYINDLYDISHQDSETLVESAADFADSGPNRNAIDAVAKERNWSPYRSVVCYLTYHLQEENLVLL